MKNDPESALALAENYERRISSLISVVSHYFSNQLSRALSDLEYLRRDGSRLSERERDAILSSICATLIAMSTRIKSMSMFSSGQLLRTDHHRVGAREILERAVDLVRPLIESKGITISLSCKRSVSIYCSPEMMVTAIVNILLNAVESFDHIYKKSKQVIVTTHLNKTDLEISVADNGQGIPSDHLSEAFEPFFTTKTRGIVLGLATARRIAKAHGGDIQIESKYGEETRVVLIVPVVGKGSKTDMEKEV